MGSLAILFVVNFRGYVDRCAMNPTFSLELYEFCDDDWIKTKYLFRYAAPKNKKKIAYAAECCCGCLPKVPIFDIGFA